jgi:predicted TIM-barrel fold metal-dependent hydrolase
MVAMQVSRREFIGGAMAVAIWASSSGCAGNSNRDVRSNGDDYSGPIIDTHLHVWDLQKFNLRWLASAGPRLNRDYSPADYVKAIEGVNVTKAIYVEVDVAPGQEEAEAAYAVELCLSKTTPTVAAVLGGNPAAAEFAAYIRKYKASQFVKGVRESYRRGWCDDAAFVSGVRLLGELGMTFDLLMGPELLGEAARLVDACPQTRFVLDHCGNPNVRWFGLSAQADAGRRRAWEEGVARLAERPNVVCKISGVAESGEDGQVAAAIVAPAVNHCLDRFGVQRVMFASNWPVCLKTIGLREWVKVLSEVVRPRGEAFARKLFYDNAARFYGL